jgi:hypothetical protein
MAETELPRRNEANANYSGGAGRHSNQLAYTQLTPVVSTLSSFRTLIFVMPVTSSRRHLM